MKYWIDTEFHEEPGRLELISLGIVAEDNREWYGVLNANDRSRPDYFDWRGCNDWVKKNVLIPAALGDPRAREGGQLFGADPTGDPYFVYRSRKDIADHLVKFFAADTTPVFWGYYCDYDWVAFCQIFGSMMSLPKTFPMFCLDLRQLMQEYWINKAQLPESYKPEHNALVDARWTRDAWKKVEHLIEHNKLPRV